MVVINKEIEKQYLLACKRFECLPAYKQIPNGVRKNKAYSFVEKNKSNKVAFILLVKHAFSFSTFEKVTKKMFIESFSREYKKYSLK